MAAPVLLAQISDLHVSADWEGIDPLPRLEAVIETICSLPNPVDAVLVSGDLTDDGGSADYELARELLERFRVPVHVLPGNHDDRAVLRATFGLPGDGADPIDYAVDVGDLRLVLLDSIVPGQDPGGFEPHQLEWLDATLAAQPERPTILAMHHSPLATGIREWDEINLDRAEIEALGEVVGRHGQLRAILAGHLHRIAASSLAGCPVLSAPSTYLQAQPDFRTEEVAMAGVPGFALHALHEGRLSSQVQSLGSFAG
jgi:3',5'-cyclic-AMP phosphodiesterase